MVRQLTRATLLTVAAAIGGTGTHAAEQAKACLENPWPQSQIRCLSKAADTAGSIEPCLLSPDPAVYWHCIAIHAEHTRDASLCEQIPKAGSIPKPVIRDLCLGHLAAAWKEPALCEQLTTPNMGDACLLKLVELGADSALCGRIAEPILTQACHELGAEKSEP